MRGQHDGRIGRGTAATRVIATLVLMTGAALASPKHKGAAPASGAMVTSFPTTGKPAGVVPYGSYCLTPLGRTGPGLIAPLGSPCTGSSAEGRVAGQTVN